VPPVLTKTEDYDMKKMRLILLIFFSLLIVIAAKSNKGELSISMTFLRLISKGIIDIESYTSEPTRVLIKRDYWNNMGTKGKDVFLNDLIRYFKIGQNKHDKYKYVIWFVVLDSNTKEKLAQGDLKTGDIEIFK
jgi:hypothetical protein